MSNELTPTASEPRGISRRTVAAGAAWAVPAVLFAGAAPALAASPVIDGRFESMCKYPGNSVTGCKFDYRTVTYWENRAETDVEVTFSFAATWDSGADVVRVFVDGEEQTGSTATIPAGAEEVKIVIIGKGSNSANTGGTVTITGSYTYNGNTYTEVVDEAFATTPPCEDTDPNCMTG